MKRYTITDARLDTCESLYVKNNASKILKTPSEILLPHTPRDGNDALSINIPRTSNPIDLSLFAPKEELLRNPQFLRQVSNGLLTLMSEEEALGILDSPEGRMETERLQSLKMKAMANLGKPIKSMDGEVTTTYNQNLETPTKGDVDPSMVGVNPAIAQIMQDSTINDSIRASMLNTFSSDGLLSARDKEYVRSQTQDSQIRKIVS